MMKCIRFSGVAIAFGLAVLFLSLPFSISQDVSVSPGDETATALESSEPFRVKVSVNEVRLDVVVVDNRGRPITDLKTTDFEVFQNDRQQNILSSVYVKNQSDMAAQPFSSRKDDRNLPARLSTDLKREDTRRTVIFITRVRTFCRKKAVTM